MRFNVFVCVTSGPADFKKTHIMTQVVYFFNLALVLRISFQDTCSNPVFIQLRHGFAHVDSIDVHGPEHVI